MVLTYMFTCFTSLDILLEMSRMWRWIHLRIRYLVFEAVPLITLRVTASSNTWNVMISTDLYEKVDKKYFLMHGLIKSVFNADEVLKFT